MKRLIALIALFTFAMFAAPALAADPVPTITASATTVQVGQPISFTVTNTAGYTPTAKIVWFNPRTFATVNVANFYGQAGPTFTYVAKLGDAGKTLQFVATIYLSGSGHLVRPSSSSVAFTVTL